MAAAQWVPPFLALSSLPLPVLPELGRGGSVNSLEISKYGTRGPPLPPP